jgi:ribose transport system substrate-binding protein
MLIHRRQVLIGSVGAAGLTIIPAFGQVPPLKKKDAYKVGFAQTESNNPWRLAQTESMKDEAAKRGAQLVYTDAAGSAAKQVADVNSMIAQGVDFIFLPPREEKPLIPAVLNAKKAGIPVLLVDRNVDPTLAKPGVDYLAFIGWNCILIANTPNMVIFASHSAYFVPDKVPQVADTLLQAHPDATIVYAHNDEMALGAIAAIEAAGKVPGKDILVVSIDGEKDAVQAIIDGKLGATCECNPRFGPAAFDILYKYANGDTIAPMIINPDRFFDASNAKDVLSSAF